MPAILLRRPESTKQDTNAVSARYASVFPPPVGNQSRSMIALSEMRPAGQRCQYKKLEGELEGTPDKAPTTLPAKLQAHCHLR